MKKLNLILLLSCAILGACSKAADSSGPAENNGPYVVKGKKGVDFNVNNTSGTWYNNVINLKSHWYYTWGLTLPLELAPQNCEYVPMFWSKATVTAANIAYAQQLRGQKKASYVLGFNEPDLADQANMSVQDALNYWPKLESINLPLGSPATSWPANQWFYDFMDKAIVQNRRVDFMCVHMYVGLDDVAFVKVLQDLHEKYQKPIWITEFATAANDARTIAENPYTPPMVLAFMQRLLPKLEALDYVQRYSWFSGSPSSARLYSSALVDASGELTELGKWYAAYQPNTLVKK